jgi:Na+/melibiose symporter-like transporter
VRPSLATVLLWGGPTIGYAFALLFVATYFLKFATDVLLLAPGIVGLLFGLARVWDAVADPIMGQLSDATRARSGRRRPWMYASIPFIALFFAMLWYPPQALGGTALVAWTTVALFGFYTAYTAYAIPHASLGAELSSDHHDRSRVFGVRHVAFVLGVFCAFGLLQLVELAPDKRAAAREAGLAAALAMGAVLLLPPLFLRERPEHRGRGAESTAASLRDVWHNPHARLLLIVSFIESLGGGVLGVLSPYIAEYVLRRPETVAFIPAFFVVASVVSVPAWLRLSRRFGKKRVWLWAMWATAFSFGATMLAGEGDVALLCALMTVAGIAGGCGGAVGSSLVADVVDWDEHATGQRKEGAYTAGAAFAQKAAVGLTVSVVGFALQASGFRPNVEQAEGALWALKGIFGGAPLVAYAIGALLFTRFQFDEHEHARLRAELDRRAMQR